MAISSGELLDLDQKIRREFPPSNVSDEYLDAHYDELPFLSAEDFRLRLSAYLLRSIEKWSPEVETCELQTAAYSERYILGKV